MPTPSRLRSEPVKRPVKYIPETQTSESPPSVASATAGPGLRELTQDLEIVEGVVCLSDAGMMRMEAGLRRIGEPSDQIRDYFRSYHGVRTQLERCRSMFE